ncbi:unnamed protein product [Paramecium pentaurelia]|uniref:Uncharacterized protein n=1 Tax=Paramecium pentaurelia TaxID=43138 RepID=A0A8S1YDJ1_9CILI|nr:unnamed protein product [Paramecium pentaurelia]
MNIKLTQYFLPKIKQQFQFCTINIQKLKNERGVLLDDLKQRDFISPSTSKLKEGQLRQLLKSFLFPAGDILMKHHLDIYDLQ